MGKYTCRCQKGFTGKNCETNIDDCMSSPCFDAPGVVCRDLVAEWQCECPIYRSGDKCRDLTDHCESDPCRHGGTCSQIEDLYSCECLPGYAGKNCEENIQECRSEPCPIYRSKCVDEIDGYTCECFIGYKTIGDGRDEICAEINECDSNPCENNAVCTDLFDEWQCFCLDGWYGLTCQNDIIDCASQPCRNGATCTEVDRQTTTDTVNDAVICTCMAGWTGDRCQHNINECLSNPCVLANGECVDSINYWICACFDGFTGQRCEIDIDDCASDPCRITPQLITNYTFWETSDKHGLECSDHRHRYQCSCQHGFTGLNCEMEIDNCLSNQEHVK